MRHGGQKPDNTILIVILIILQCLPDAFQLVPSKENRTTIEAYSIVYGWRGLSRIPVGPQFLTVGLTFFRMVFFISAMQTLGSWSQVLTLQNLELVMWGIKPLQDHLTCPKHPTA